MQGATSTKPSPWGTGERPANFAHGIQRGGERSVAAKTGARYKDAAYLGPLDGEKTGEEGNRRIVKMITGVGIRKSKDHLVHFFGQRRLKCINRLLKGKLR